MKQHDVKWHTAAPVWPLALADAGAATLRFERPLLLRFAGDDFMDRFSGMLAGSPARLAEFTTRNETWRTPLLEQVGWQDAAAEAASDPPKLFQPAHNRFYLAVASLVCRTRGLPDRTVDKGAEDRVSFLIRRLVAKAGQPLDPSNPATYDEHGWFGDRQDGIWLPIAQPGVDLAEGEERLPMFPTTFEQDGRKRRLWAGMIPVASREAYEAGVEKASVEAIAGEAMSDPRVGRFSSEVSAPILGLSGLPDDVSASNAQDALIFVLITFGSYLVEHLPAVWTDISGGAAATGPSAVLVTRLRSATHAIDGFTWAALLVNANEPVRRAQFLAGQRPLSLTPIGEAFTRAQIVNGADSFYGSGSTLVTLVDNILGDPRRYELDRLIAERIAPLGSLSAALTDAGARQLLLDALLELTAYLDRELPDVWAAIASGSTAGLPAAKAAVVTFLEARSLGAATWRAVLASTEAQRAAIGARAMTGAVLVERLGIARAQVQTFAGQMADGSFATTVGNALAADPIVPPPPPTTPTPDSYYCLRCVYERPRCEPSERPVISRASRPFRLASFFDPDAPVRPVRVRMPVDTSFSGLSKFPKNVSFLLSKELREQMARAESAGLKKLMDGESGSASFDLGVICSFSIPIITICALILLMIIVQLLNIVFWWVPLFRICLPLNLKGK